MYVKESMKRFGTSRGAGARPAPPRRFPQPLASRRARNDNELVLPTLLIIIKGVRAARTSAARPSRGRYSLLFNGLALVPTDAREYRYEVSNLTQFSIVINSL